MVRLGLAMLIVAGLVYLNELGTHRIEVDRDFPVEPIDITVSTSSTTMEWCALNDGAIPDSCVGDGPGRIIFEVR